MVFKRPVRAKSWPPGLHGAGRLSGPAAGGWTRAGARYVVHRLRRLPDPAHKISPRHFAAAASSSPFTPVFFGLSFPDVGGHRLRAARQHHRGLLLAGPSWGNPPSHLFPSSPRSRWRRARGYWGTPHMPLTRRRRVLTRMRPWNSGGTWRPCSPPRSCTGAGSARFSRWSSCPYLVGGILPGPVAALPRAYFLSHPLIVAYQKTRHQAAEGPLREAPAPL